MAISAERLARGDFSPDGTFEKSVTGRCRPAEVMAAFVTIEGQKRWFTDVKDGRWVSGTPEAVGGVRQLALGGPLWTRHQLTRIEPGKRVEYLLLESSTGMPIQGGRIVVTIESDAPSLDEVGLTTVRIDFRYVLMTPFKLMKGQIQKRVAESLGGGVERLVRGG